MYLETAVSNAKQHSAYFRSLSRSASSSPRKGSLGSSMGGVLSGSDSALNSLVGSSDTQSEQQYDKFKGWQYCAIRAIANRAASQPVMMGSKVSAKRILRRGSLATYKAWEKLSMPSFVKSNNQAVEKIEDHPLMSAIDDPNPLMVRWTLLYVTIASMELTGLSYWWFTEEKDEDTGEMKLQVWFVPAHWVTPVHEKSKGRFFSHYDIGPGVSKIRVPGNRIARFALPDPSDPLGVISPLQTQSRSITTDEYIQESQMRQFKNGFKPGVIIHAGRLPDDPVTGAPGELPILEAWQRRELIESLRGAYQGVVNAHEPFIVDGLIEKVDPFTINPAEMDYTNSGQITKSRIMQAYGVNPMIIGEIEGANRAQAALAEENLAANVINPLLEMISQIITKWLPSAAKSFESIPDDSQGKLLFWFAPTRVNDADLRLAECSATPGPAITLNEYRTNVLHLEPIEGGDVCAEEYLAKRTAPPPGSGLIPGQSQGQEEPDDDEGDSQESGSPKKKPPGKPPGKIEKKPPGKPGKKDFSHATYKSSRRDKIWGVQQSQAVDQAKKFFSKHFAGQWPVVKRSLSTVASANPELFVGDATAEQAKARAATIVDKIYDDRKWSRSLLKSVKSVLLNVMSVGAATEITLLASSLSRGKAARQSKLKIPSSVSKRIDTELKQILKQPYWQKVSKSTKSSLQTAIAGGLAKGHSLEQISSSVQQVFVGRRKGGMGNVSAGQASNIAATEITGALQGGQYAVVKELQDAGVTVTRWWKATFHRTRTSHADASGTKPDKHGLFTVGRSKAPYPGWYGLPAEERCRCACHTEHEYSGFPEGNGSWPSELLDTMDSFGLLESIVTE